MAEVPTAASKNVTPPLPARSIQFVAIRLASIGLTVTRRLRSAEDPTDITGQR
jgi:hypothetical protein